MYISGMLDSFIEDYENDELTDSDENPTEADLIKIEQMEKQRVLSTLKRQLTDRKKCNGRDKTDYVKPVVEVTKTLPQNLFSSVDTYKSATVESEHDICNDYRHITKTPLFDDSYYREGSNRTSIFASLDVMKAFVEDYKNEEITKNELRYKYCCGAHKALGTLYSNVVNLLERIDKGDERAISRVKGLGESKQ